MAQRRKSPGDGTFAGKSAQFGEGMTLTRAQSLIEADRAVEGGPRDMTCEGRVVGIENDKIVGWAWNSAKPYDPVVVELYINDVRVGRGPADLFDLELARTNRGNGMHRFQLGIEKLPAGAPPFIVRAVIAETEVELLPAIALETIDAAERLLSGNEYLGRVTGIADGMVCGWVLNWNNPHEQPSVTLFDGDAVVLSRLPLGRTTALIDNGVTADVHKFELPLPTNVLDGRQHALSVRVGASERELAGSPVMFGPTDVASIGQTLATAFDRLYQLDRKVTALQPNLDNGLLEKRIVAGILNRVDMLLNIHRDSIERELALLRRQVRNAAPSDADADVDVIRPVEKQQLIEDEPVQPVSAFSTVARAVPLMSYDLSSKPVAARLLGDLDWQLTPDSAGVAIRGNGSIELAGVPQGPASLLVQGKGAKDATEFCAMVAAFQGHQLTGRVDISENGEWTLLGTGAPSAIESAAANGLGIIYLPELGRPSGKLCIEKIAVMARFRVPERTDLEPPEAVVLYVGTDVSRNGWYAFEPGAAGGSTWMAAQAELSFRIRQTGRYQLRIPTIRPLTPDTLTKLKISLGGVPVAAEITPLRSDRTLYELRADARVPHQLDDDIVLRLSFPDDCVRSPQELGMNADRRLLAIALRSVALTSIAE
jgi:hypothetical protein